jgi:hypothetical protein
MSKAYLQAQSDDHGGIKWGREPKLRPPLEKIVIRACTQTEDKRARLRSPAWAPLQSDFAVEKRMRSHVIFLA